MKRLVFKNWVSYLLGIVMMMLVMFVLGGECEDTMLFISSKVVAGSIAYGCYKLLDKYASSELMGGVE